VYYAKYQTKTKKASKKAKRHDTNQERLRVLRSKKRSRRTTTTTNRGPTITVFIQGGIVQLNLVTMNNNAWLSRFVVVRGRGAGDGTSNSNDNDDDDDHSVAEDDERQEEGEAEAAGASATVAPTAPAPASASGGGGGGDRRGGGDVENPATSTTTAEEEADEAGDDVEEQGRGTSAVGAVLAEEEEDDRPSSSQRRRQQQRTTGGLKLLLFSSSTKERIRNTMMAPASIPSSPSSLLWILQSCKEFFWLHEPALIRCSLLFPSSSCTRPPLPSQLAFFFRDTAVTRTVPAALLPPGKQQLLNSGRSEGDDNADAVGVDNEETERSATEATAEPAVPVDYYRILGVDRSCSKEEIEAAYRAKSFENASKQFERTGEVFPELLAKAHPSPTSSIQQAYEHLIDDDKRLRYDHQLLLLEQQAALASSPPPSADNNKKKKTVDQAKPRRFTFPSAGRKTAKKKPSAAALPSHRDGASYYENLKQSTFWERARLLLFVSLSLMLLLLQPVLILSKVNQNATDEPLSSASYVAVLAPFWIWHVAVLILWATAFLNTSAKKIAALARKQSTPITGLDVKKLFFTCCTHACLLAGEFAMAENWDRPRNEQHSWNVVSAPFYLALFIQATMSALDLCYIQQRKQKRVENGNNVDTTSTGIAPDAVIFYDAIGTLLNVFLILLPFVALVASKASLQIDGSWGAVFTTIWMFLLYQFFRSIAICAVGNENPYVRSTNEDVVEEDVDVEKQEEQVQRSSSTTLRPQVKAVLACVGHIYKIVIALLIVGKLDGNFFNATTLLGDGWGSGYGGYNAYWILFPILLPAMLFYCFGLVVIFGAGNCAGIDRMMERLSVSFFTTGDETNQNDETVGLAATYSSSPRQKDDRLSETEEETERRDSLAEPSSPVPTPHIVRRFLYADEIPTPTKSEHESVPDDEMESFVEGQQLKQAADNKVVVATFTSITPEVEQADVESFRFAQPRQVSEEERDLGDSEPKSELKVLGVVTSVTNEPRNDDTSEEGADKDPKKVPFSKKHSIKKKNRKQARKKKKYGALDDDDQDGLAPLNETEEESAEGGGRT